MCGVCWHGQVAGPAGAPAGVLQAGPWPGQPARRSRRWRGHFLVIPPALPRRVASCADWWRRRQAPVRVFSSSLSARRASTPRPALPAASQAPAPGHGISRAGAGRGMARQGLLLFHWPLLVFRTHESQSDRVNVTLTCLWPCCSFCWCQAVLSCFALHSWLRPLGLRSACAGEADLCALPLQLKLSPVVFPKPSLHTALPRHAHGHL